MKNYYVYKADDGQIVLVDDIPTFISNVYDPELHTYAGIMLSVTEGKSFQDTINKALKLYENPSTAEGDVFVADEPEPIKRARNSFEKQATKDRKAAYDFLERARQSLRTAAKMEAEKLGRDPEHVFNIMKIAYISQIEKMRYEDEV